MVYCCNCLIEASSMVSEPTLPQPLIDLCRLPSDPGTCDTYSKQWFYNSRSSTCEQFDYAGCQGNENRFTDEEACKRTCIMKQCPSSQV